MNHEKLIYDITFREKTGFLFLVASVVVSNYK